jgi:hypothetical protein
MYQFGQVGNLISIIKTLIVLTYFRKLPSYYSSLLNAITANFRVLLHLTLKTLRKQTRVLAHPQIDWAMYRESKSCLGSNGQITVMNLPKAIMFCTKIGQMIKRL